MTIAACLVTAGGVVFGADSTTTISLPDEQGHPTDHYFHHAQKLFEVGNGGSLAVVTWGLGTFDDVSYRLVFAQLADWVLATAPTSVLEVAQRFIQQFWALYSDPASVLAKPRAAAQALLGKAHPDDLQNLEILKGGWTVGFCIGGNTSAERQPAALEIVFSPEQTAPPKPNPLEIDRPHFWGVPNIMRRVIFAIDPQVVDAILDSPHWGGTERQLLDLVDPFVLKRVKHLPIREAIDYVNTIISTTCKGLKFSHWRPVCGGRVEIAVITADRRFRWVKHKSLRQALK